MNNYMFVVEYDGTKYNGWQRLQKNKEKSIQGKIEILLSKLLEEDIQITGSGRTDAGVHALMQTCNFKSAKLLNDDFIIEFNRYMPQDIKVKTFIKVDDRFHSRFNVKKKIYMYRIDISQFGNPFMRNYAYHLGPRLDVARMEKASKMFLGEHDFTSFSKGTSKNKSTVKTIDNIKFKVEGDMVEVYFEAKSFLYNMVRILIGTLIELGLNKISEEHIENLLKNPSREEFRFTAPPHGLFLYDIEY